MTSKAPQKMPEGLERPKAPAAPPTGDVRVNMSKYKLVPTELTDEMVDASGCEGYFKMSPHEQAQEMWEAMLAAAPAVQGEPVAFASFADMELCMHRPAGGEWTPVYTAPQPVPDVAQLVDTLVACARASSAAEVGLIVDEAMADYWKRG